MGLHAVYDPHVRGFVEVAAAHEGHLVWPIVDVAPVWLVVFKEFSIKLEIFSDFDHDVIGFNGLIPSA